VFPVGREFEIGENAERQRQLAAAVGFQNEKLARPIFVDHENNDAGHRIDFQVADVPADVVGQPGIFLRRPVISRQSQEFAAGVCRQVNGFPVGGKGQVADRGTVVTWQR
jgi:hypothetical protein